jgi:acetyl-CoA C-acetyltransferase
MGSVIDLCKMELKRRGGGTGVAALCDGGGRGDALIIIVPSAGS